MTASVVLACRGRVKALSWQRLCFAANVERNAILGRSVSSFDIRKEDKEVLDESHLITILRETTGCSECTIIRLKH